MNIDNGKATKGYSSSYDQSKNFVNGLIRLKQHEAKVRGERMKKKKD